MNTPVSIDSSKARSNFYDLLNSVYTKNKSYIIKKSGIPVARLVSINDNVVKKDFLDFAGMLTEEEGNKLLKLVESGRRDGSSKKKYLANWK
jgi:prevent-host-death family protein